MRHLAIALAAAASVCAVPAQQRVYIAPDDHTDYWWSGTEASYQQAFVNTLDYYLNAIDASAGAPADFQARWNCDGWTWMWDYQRNRSTAEFQRLLSRIQDGHVSVPLNAFCVCLGGTPTEAVLRGMYYPGQIERAHNVHFRLGYLMENQTVPLGVWSLFAGAGGRWSWKGICGCASQVPAAWDRSHDIYWATGLDGSRMLMKWNSMLNGNQAMGGYAEARNPQAIVGYVTTDANFQARYPFNVIGCFGKGWDDFQTMTGEFPLTAQNSSTPQLRVVCSNEEDFFADFESTYGALIPSESLSYGNEWELHSASLAEVTARVRRAAEKLRPAEALAAVAGRRAPSLLAGRQAARDQAWVDFGQYYEHDFGMDGFAPAHPWVVGRIAWQRRLADEIDGYVDALHGDAGNELGAQLPLGANPRFFVFNPLGWQRTDVADFAWSGPTNVHVVDAAQVEVPCQLLTVAGQQTLRIQARNLPAVGYGVYEVVSGPGTFAACGTITGTGDLVLDNGVHAVRVTSTGAIASLVDHGQQNREFARSVNGLLLNDLGGATGGTVALANAGPVSLSVVAQCSLPVPHTTTVTLYRDGDRVEVQDTIDANFTSTQTWSFGLNLDNPDVHHEEVGAVLHARVTPAGDYAARTARYDWLSLGHFADMVTTGGVGVTLSNRDCAFFKLGNSTSSTLDVGTPLLAVLAGGAQIGSPTGGLPAQGGDSSFLHRFAMRTHSGYDPAAAMRTALEHQNPLVTGQVTGTNVQLPVGPLGTISISDPNVLLWTLKPAEEGLGQGLIARLWNVTSQPRTASIALLQDTLRSAFETTHIETNVASLPVNAGSVALSFQPQQLRTVRLRSDIAAIATYGSGCPGFNGAATLSAVGDSLPALGQNLVVEIQPVAAGVLPVVTVGFGNAQSPFGPLPLDLGFVGMPGCSLLVNPLLSAPVLPQNGVASLTLAVPSSNSLIGADVFLQAALLPPLVSQAIGVTAGLQARVGR